MVFTLQIEYMTNKVKAAIEVVLQLQSEGCGQFLRKNSPKIGHNSVCVFTEDEHSLSQRLTDCYIGHTL